MTALEQILDLAKKEDALRCRLCSATAGEADRIIEELDFWHRLKIVRINTLKKGRR